MSEDHRLLLGTLGLVLLVPLLFAAMMADGVFGEPLLLAASLLVVVLIIAVVVWLVG